MVEQNLQYFARGSVRSSPTPTKTYSSPKTTTSTPSGTTSTKSTTPTKTITPKTGTSTAKPGSKVTVNGKEVQTSSKRPSNSKYTKSTGVVGDNGYQPRYTNGYTPPAGSVVYRENNSALDYLPWIYLFSVMGDSPRNDQQTIVQPDGKEVQAKPVQQGVDGLLILNWIILIIIVAAIVGGIVWLVNKLTNKSKPSYA